MFDAPIFLPFRAVCCQPTAATVMVEAWTLWIICFCNSRKHLRDRDSCGSSSKGLFQLGLRKQHLMADRKQSRSIFRFLADGSYCCQWNSVKELWPSSIWRLKPSKSRGTIVEWLHGRIFLSYVYNVFSCVISCLPLFWQSLNSLSDLWAVFNTSADD